MVWIDVLHPHALQSIGLVLPWPCLAHDLPSSSLELHRYIDSRRIVFWFSQSLGCGTVLTQFAIF